MSVRKTSRASKSQPAYREVHIDSWGALVENLDSLSVNWVFRLHADAHWTLHSTLARRLINAGIDKRAWTEQETRILRIFKSKAHLFVDHIPDDSDSFRWLGMMQHHGAPTRLLDFTYSFYVAAFFALENATGNAAIWALNLHALDAQPPMAVDARQGLENYSSLRMPGIYEEFFLPNSFSFVTFGYPHAMNQRLIAQSGIFVVPSTILESTEQILSHYSNPKILVKYVLDTSKLRTIVLRKLYGMNITYYSLFPGLDGLARSLGFESEYNWKFDPLTMAPKPED